MDLLEQIVSHKKTEVESAKELYPLKLLEKSVHYSTSSVSLRKYLQRSDRAGIIAEIKRHSPSKGMLNEHISVEKLSIGYMQAGASALSILTDTRFFHGKKEDLTLARKFNFCPILRKDFMIDSYQISEAKSIGADVILLIARILTPEKTKELAKFARSIGLEVLLEIHNAQELKSHINEYVDVVGVNNRDLDTLKMNLELSFALAAEVPKDFLKISESGISQAETIRKLKAVGYNGFLIGETFMKTTHPERACAKLIAEVMQGKNSKAEVE